MCLPPFSLSFKKLNAFIASRHVVLPLSFFPIIGIKDSFEILISVSSLIPLKPLIINLRDYIEFTPQAI